MLVSVRCFTQDISQAGKQLGMDGFRSSLCIHIFRLLDGMPLACSCSILTSEMSLADHAFCQQTFPVKPFRFFEHGIQVLGPPGECGRFAFEEHDRGYELLG